MAVCLSGGDDMIARRAKRVSHDQHAARGVQAGDVPSLFALIVEPIVKNIIGERIIKHLAGLVEGDAIMIDRVDSRFRIIPGKPFILDNYGLTVVKSSVKADNSKIHPGGYTYRQKPTTSEASQSHPTTLPTSWPERPSTTLPAMAYWLIRKSRRQSAYSRPVAHAKDTCITMAA